MADGSEMLAATVRAGYDFDGPAIALGALATGDGANADAQVRLPLAMLNRHGLIAGATGTGKTKTLQLISEQLSEAGVPVFLADIKGDLSGMATPAQPSGKLTARGQELGADWVPAAFPTEFYTLGGRGAGIPIRATVTSFGPTLLAKVLHLTEVQESSLGLVFHFADTEGLPLLDLKDLRAVISYLTSEEGSAALAGLGGMSKQTAGVLLRELVALADAGAEDFFGEPEFDTRDLMRTAEGGKGVVNILELPGVAQQPTLFSTFLMWLLADLFEELPEVGDVDKPKLVFFLDEAHLLFTGASKAFLQAITQTVRLIRSKGVGVLFVTQTPTDVHREVLAQLGNRVQHALRAYTPDDAKALRATVSTFPRSAYNLEELLTQLGIGEAVVTVLSETGAPTPVARTKLRAPRSAMAPAPPDIVAAAVEASSLRPKYADVVDRESAYERLASRNTPARPPAHRPPMERPRAPRPRRRAASEESHVVEKVLGNTAVRGFLRSAATTAGREIIRGVFGTARRRR